MNDQLDRAIDTTEQQRQPAMATIPVQIASTGRLCVVAIPTDPELTDQEVIELASFVLLQARAFAARPRESGIVDALGLPLARRT